MGDTRDAPAWLRPVYAARQARTVELVRRSVDALRASGRRVSLAAIVAEAKRLDAAGRGVSESAVLHNDAARTYYEQHRTWRAAGAAGAAGQTSRQRRSHRAAHTAHTAHAAPVRSSAVRPDRDEARVRRRYLWLSKPELVVRLVAAERTSAAAHERWLAMNDEVLTWMLLVNWLFSAHPQSASHHRKHHHFLRFPPSGRTECDNRLKAAGMALDPAAVRLHGEHAQLAVDRPVPLPELRELPGVARRGRWFVRAPAVPVDRGDPFGSHG